MSSVMSSPTSIADPMAPMAVTDVSDVAYDEEHKNAVDNNQKSTWFEVLLTSISWTQLLLGDSSIESDNTT